MGVMQRDLFWPAPIIRDRRQFDFDGETVKNGIDDFDVLEDFAADFGYITVFQVDDQFYDDQGGKVKAVEVDDPNPKITTGENEILARIGYKTMNFGMKERDAFVLNKACFKKANMHPVFVLKITNPYSKIEPEPKVPGLQRCDSTDTYRSFGTYTTERREKEEETRLDIIEDELDANVRECPPLLRRASEKILRNEFPEFSMEWMQRIANGSALWDRAAAWSRLQVKRQNIARDKLKKLVSLVRYHISTMKPKVDSKSLQDDVSGAKNVTSGIATRLCSSEDKPQKRTRKKIRPDQTKTTQRVPVRINVKTRTVKR